MKKKVFLIMIVVLTMLLTSCSSIFGSNTDNDDSDDSNDVKEITVTLVNALGSKTVVAKCGEELIVSQPTRSGYYFVGYYDSEVGGVNYIDKTGASNSVWQEEYPTTLYAQWNSISGMNYDSEVDNADKAAEFGFYSKSYYYHLPSDFKNAINGNLNETVTVTVHFKAKESPKGIGSYAPVTIKLRDGSDDGAITLAKHTLTPPNEYQSYDLEFSTKAGNFKNGTVYVMFDLGYANTSLYLRNISISIAFN